MHRRLASRSLPSQDGCARPIVVRRSRGDEPPTAGGDGSGAADGSWQPSLGVSHSGLGNRRQRVAGMSANGGRYTKRRCVVDGAPGEGGRAEGRDGGGSTGRHAAALGYGQGANLATAPPRGGGDALMHENGSPCPSRPGASGWPITSCLQLTSPGLRWWQRRQMREH